MKLFPVYLLHALLFGIVYCILVFDSNIFLEISALILSALTILFLVFNREKQATGTIQVFRNGDETRKINLQLDLTPEEMEKLDLVIFNVDIREENT